MKKQNNKGNNNKDRKRLLGRKPTCNPPLKPFLKWAGGKRWLVTNHSHLFPKNFNRYIEPFLGSGAIFFHLNPKQALLGDSNIELIETYKALKKNWKLVLRYLKEHHRNHSEDYYYRLRSSLNNSSASRAAQFIYLNRTCWNGLYRVNQNGIFNVPIGTKSSVVFEDDNFKEISNVLKGVKLYSCDFEVLIDKAIESDLVFVDPPYTVRHNHNAFIKYNEKLFSWNDQKRLSKALKRAKKRGVQIVGTNAYHRCITDLYEKSFITFPVSHNSPISSTPESRAKFEELVFLTEPKNAKTGR